jgi:asparagine synthase (glutamine-hydrolysing)
MPIVGAMPGVDLNILTAALRALRRESNSSEMRWDEHGIALAVCDDSTICSKDELSLLLDGRIDNYAEIAIALGIENTGAPTVLLHAYRRWRENFPKHVLGDFALALWDGRNRRLLLARDVAGYRPLHYWVRGNEFRFASEAIGLLAYGDIAIAVNERRVAHWLTRIPERTGATFCQNISSVPPGHTLVYERGRVTLSDFWRPENIPLLRLSDRRGYVDGLRCVLRQAVDDRIRSAAGVGSHLSGGLDSSSVTATAAVLLAERGARLTAFTAVPAVPVDDARFPRRFCDEASHAAATAALYPNIDHVLIPTNSRSVFQILDLMSSAAECPQLNPGNSVWLYAICVEAQQRGLNVLLTGASGNFTISYDGRRALSTLLAAGRIFAAARLASDVHRNGSTWRSTLRLAARPLLPSFARHGLDRLRRSPALKVEDATGLRPEFALSLGISPQEAIESAEVLDGRYLRLWSLRRNDFGGHIAAFRRLTGVEQTDPTSDRRVMEFCLSVPEERYCTDGCKRSLIKDAMARSLPLKVLREQRVGRQSADLLFHLTHEKREIAAELQRLQKSDLAARCLNLPLLQTMVQSWPEPPYGYAEHNRYGTQLMRALSMGRFIRRIEEGVLFQDQHSPSP